MAPVREWVLLAYRLPREPSGPRVTMWRKLRRLGAVQLVDGLVALPASSQNRERLDWLADEVLDAGGEAWTFDAEPGSKEQQRALAARLTDAAAEDYRALLEEADGCWLPASDCSGDRLIACAASCTASRPATPFHPRSAQRSGESLIV